MPDIAEQRLIVNDTVTIKVQIANRTYPLKIRSSEEARYQEAASLVNERIREYSEAFAVKDQQDLLAMCAFQLALQEDISTEIDSLSQLVQRFRVL